MVCNEAFLVENLVCDEGMYNGMVTCNHRKGPNRAGEYECMRCHRRHGEGTLTTPNGVVYSGIWNTDKFTGIGSMTRANEGHDASMVFTGTCMSRREVKKQAAALRYRAKSEQKDVHMKKWSANFSYKDSLEPDATIPPLMGKPHGRGPKQRSDSQSSGASKLEMLQNGTALEYKSPTKPYGAGSYGGKLSDVPMPTWDPKRLERLAKSGNNYVDRPPSRCVKEFDQIFDIAEREYAVKFHRRKLSPACNIQGTRSMAMTLPSYANAPTTSLIPGHPGAISRVRTPPLENKVSREPVREVGERFERDWLCGDGDVTDMISPYGDVYNGQVKMGQPSGKGRCEYTNGSVFVGGWREGKWHGLGTQTMSDGTELTGDFNLGRIKDYPVQGRGDFTWNCGGKFAGQWDMQRPWNGRANRMPQGKEGTPDFKYFTGEIRNGVKCDPQGLEVDVHTGNIYTGNFEDDEIKGRGVLVYPDGGRFEGKFRKGLPLEGRAHELPLPNGDKYTGEWNAGAPNGRGSLRHYEPNGAEHVFGGNFVDGKHIGGVMDDPRRLPPVATPGIGMRRKRASRQSSRQSDRSGSGGGYEATLQRGSRPMPTMIETVAMGEMSATVPRSGMGSRGQGRNELAERMGTLHPLRTLPRHVGFTLKGMLPYAEPAGLRNVGDM